jgi:hypothetical protein
MPAEQTKSVAEQRTAAAETKVAKDEPKKILYPPNAPGIAREFTAILIDPSHKDYSTIRARHVPHYQGNTTLQIIALAWINATLRVDNSPLTPQMIGNSIVSIKNSDGSLTAVTTVLGPLSTATVDAPLEKGVYQYVVQHTDTSGTIGVPCLAINTVAVDRAWQDPALAKTG